MKTAAILLRNAMKRLANTLLPQVCVLCHGSSRNALLCEPCLRSMPRMFAQCQRCAVPVRYDAVCGACIRHPPHFDATFATSRYEFPLDRLMHAYKYGSLLPIAVLFADLLSTVIGDEPKVDLIIPLPLASRRLRERGFNQSQEIARRLGARMGIAVDPSAAMRIRETEAQAVLPIGERIRNVRNAFRATSNVMGRRVAVVDDVMTTGATLDEFARTLKSHGALHVENWVVARALLDP